MTILVIEDDPDLLVITSKRLEKIGFKVLSASNLTEARNHFESALNNLDAVISDLFIGTENGVSFFEEIKSPLSDTPFIIVTGDSEGDPRVTQFASSFANFYCLEKPFSSESLRQTLQKARVKTA